MQQILRSPAPSVTDRFLTFAFAAAELLVETDAGGRITFAEGAFPARFGRPGRSFIGQPVLSLVARDLRSGMGTALELLSATGRIRPTAIRLADGMRSPFSVAGLAMPGRQGHFCLTFSPLPSELPGGSLPGGPGLARAAEEMLRTGETPSALGLIELLGDGGPLAFPAGELVRFAEKLLEQGDVTQALECLQEALKRQPENVYIPAVIQRAVFVFHAFAAASGVSPTSPVALCGMGVRLSQA